MSHRLHLVLSDRTHQRAQAFQEDLGFRTLNGFIETAINSYIEELRTARNLGASLRAPGAPPRPPVRIGEGPEDLPAGGRGIAASGKRRRSR